MKFIYILLLCSILSAQNVVKGTVFDSRTGESLFGAQVQIVGTFIGASTDENGAFELNYSKKIQEIEVSLVGYETQKFAQLASELKIQLTPKTLTDDVVVVTANRIEAKRTEQPIAISKVDAQEIEATRAVTLSEVVNKVAGVNMIDLGSEQHSMSIRQPMSYKAYFLYLEDGLPIRPMGIFNHNALIEMNMFGTSSLEVVKGPSSSIYGPEAIGGAINFVTRTPSFQNSMKFGAQSTTEGNKRIRMNANQIIADNVGLNISGYYTNQTDGFAEHTDYEKFSLNARLDYLISDKLKLTSFTAYHYLDADMGGGSVKADAFKAKEFGSLHSFAFRKVNSLRTKLTLDYDIDKNQQLVSTLFYRDNNMDQNPSYRVKDDFKPWTNSGDKTKATGEENSNQFKSYGALIQHTYNIDNTRLITGLYRDYSPQDYEALFINVTQDETTRKYLSYELTDQLLTDYTADILNTAAYVQFEQKIGNTLNIVGGLRFDDITFWHKDALGQKEDGKTSYDNWSPKLGLTYNPANEYGFYGNYSQGFYAPGVSELFRASANNQNLKPAYFDNYEIGGWTQLTDDIKLEYSLYQLNGKDEVITYRDEDGNYENRNAGETSHQGIEFTLDYRASEELNIRFNGSYAEHKYEDFFVEKERIETDWSGTNTIPAVDYTGNEQALAPKWISDFDISYKPETIEGLALGLQWSYRSSYYMDDANTVKYEPSTFLGLKGNSVVNFRSTYRLKEFDFFVNVENLSDEYYSNSASKSQWGESYRLARPRTFVFGLNYNFDY